MTFTVTVGRHPDEMLLSLIKRSAGYNGLRTVRDMWMAADLGRCIDRTRRTLDGLDDDDFDALANVAAIGRDELVASTRAGSNRPSLRRRFRWRDESCVSKYCPSCLQENQAWRLEWQLPYVAACSIHSTLLVDHTEQCVAGTRGPNWFSGNATVVCERRRCMTNLATTGVRDADPRLLTAQKQMIEHDSQGLVFLNHVPWRRTDPSWSFAPGIHQREAGGWIVRGPLSLAATVQALLTTIRKPEHQPHTTHPESETK